MLNVEDWAEIRRLRRSECLPISEIARVLGVSRNTVKSALASDAPPKYQRAPAGSVADEAEPRIRELLSAYPRMPATVIAERIDWAYSIRTLSERVRELRPVYLPPDPASRTTYVAGEIAQCDFWFPDVEVPVGYGQVRTATTTSGVDDGVWVFAVGISWADPDPYRRRPVCGLVATYFSAGRGAAGVGVGR